MATPSTATMPWLAVQAVLDHRGQYGLPREARTLLGPRRQPGDFPLNEAEIDQKIAAGVPRTGADPKIMTPSEEAEWVRNYQFLSGKLSPQEIEARMAEEDTRARLAEQAVLQERDKALAEQTRVRDEEFLDNLLRERRAEETFVNQQQASQAFFEAKVKEQVTEEALAERAATLLSQEEVAQANFDAQQREEKTRAEIAARDREEWGAQNLELFKRFGFGSKEIETLSINFEPWGGNKGTEEAFNEEVQSWEKNKALGFVPGPDTGEMARPQTRNASFLSGEIVDTFA
jgi:hypothetical protein